ncbi:unnamed protein product [Camellia sinensis]
MTQDNKDIQFLDSSAATPAYIESKWCCWNGSSAPSIILGYSVWKDDTAVLNAGKNKLKSMDEGRSLLSLRALILNGMEREVKFFTETKENNQMRGPRTGMATNWAKFSATAGLGVIHRGHLQQGRSLMAPYLPQSGAGGGGSPYSEGGALYALDLIHANHGEGIKTISSLFSMVHAWVWAWQLLELLMKISMTTSEAVNFVRNQLRQHGDVQSSSGKPVYMYSMGGLADFCVVPVHEGRQCSI